MADLPPSDETESNADGSSPAVLPSVDAEADDMPAGEVERRFRQQTQALAAFWILLGLLLLASAGYLALYPKRGEQLFGPLQHWFVIWLATTGAMWLVAGIGTWLRHIFAVYLGLFFSYVSLLAQIANLNLCGLIVVLGAIVLAHRVLSDAKRIARARGAAPR